MLTMKRHSSFKFLACLGNIILGMPSHTCSSSMSKNLLFRSLQLESNSWLTNSGFNSILVAKAPKTASAGYESLSSQYFPAQLLGCSTSRFFLLPKLILLESFLGGLFCRGGLRFPVSGGEILLGWFKARSSWAGQIS